MPTVTKAEIVDQIHESLGGYSRREVAEFVERLLEEMKSTLEAGTKIKISGFGNFTVRQKRARAGRNPQNGDKIMIASRRVLSFKASQVLKDALNEG